MVTPMIILGLGFRALFLLFFLLLLFQPVSFLWTQASKNSSFAAQHRSANRFLDCEPLLEVCRLLIKAS